MGEDFDVVVIGAGSAGFAAARTASELGARVALIDKGPLGGLCILWGCMPSKALLRSAEVVHLIREAQQWGVSAEQVSVDFRVVMQRKNRLIKGFADDRIHQIHALPNTELVMGHARFVGLDTVQVGDRRLRGEHLIIATGSRPMIPPIPGLQEVGYFQSEDALAMTVVPRSMLVVGGGVIAVELGQFFARMGSEVTLFEAAPQLLPKEDPDVAAALTEAFRDEGIRVEAGIRILRVEDRSGRKVAVIADSFGERECQAEAIFVATGRVPNLEGLDLDKAGVSLDGRRIRLDAFMRTTNHRIYAAGDAWGGSYLVHVAIAEGETAARNACEHAAVAMDYRVVPHAVFTDPNVARVGPSERDFQAQGRRVLVASYPFSDHGKAEVMGGTATRGFVKLIADAFTGEILGAQAVGPEAADLIHELVAVISLRGTIGQFVKIPHVHPTLAEIWTYPAEEILGKFRREGMQPRVTLLPSGYGPDEAEVCPGERPSARPE